MHYKNISIPEKNSCLKHLFRKGLEEKFFYNKQSIFCLTCEKINTNVTAGECSWGLFGPLKKWTVSNFKSTNFCAMFTLCHGYLNTFISMDLKVSVYGGPERGQGIRGSTDRNETHQTVIIIITVKYIGFEGNPNC